MEAFRVYISRDPCRPEGEVWFESSKANMEVSTIKMKFCLPRMQNPAHSTTPLYQTTSKVPS